jgi:outer membrane lipoprotein SlyB
MKKLPLLLCALLVTTSCAKNMSNDVYTEGSVAGKVLEGKVISIRNVTIKSNAKLQENTAGGLAGGLAGGVAGSAVGNGAGSSAAAVGGALLGALGGALAQDALSSSEGVEYLVKLDKKNLQEYRSISKKIQSSGNKSIEEDMASAEVSTKTDIVSIVQASDPAIRKGSSVYIIYNNDRPRVTAKE